MSGCPILIPVDDAPANQKKLPPQQRLHWALDLKKSVEFSRYQAMADEKKAELLTKLLDPTVPDEELGSIRKQYYVAADFADYVDGVEKQARKELAAEQAKGEKS